MYYDHLRHNNNFHEAAIFQHENAMCDDKIFISQRIEYLSKAERNAKEAELLSNKGNKTIKSQFFRKELHYLFKIAEIQLKTKNIYENELEKLNNNVDKANYGKLISFFQERIVNLEYTVQDANSLFTLAIKEFGNFTMSSLWHIAIHIILISSNSGDAYDALEHILKHKTGLTPKEMLKKLIRSYIYKEVPKKANRQSSLEFLRLNQQNLYIDNNYSSGIKYSNDSDEHGILNEYSFEDYDHWLPNLEESLNILYKQVHDLRDDSIVLPYQLILEEITAITIHLIVIETQNNPNHDSITKLRIAPFQILNKIGVRNDKLISYYYTIFGKWVNNANNEEKCVHLCRSVISCLYNWNTHLR
jgi:hypothetical protein